MQQHIDFCPDAEQRRRIMDFVIAAGRTLLENGAEVFRAEQTMQIMAKSFHLREFHVYVLTNGIFASAGTAEISEVCHVPKRTIHLGRVAGVNELSREIVAGELTLAQAELRLAEVRRLPFPPNWLQVVAGAIGSFCFAMLFGGSPASGCLAALAGLAVSGYLVAAERLQIPVLFQKMSGAALITLVCVVCAGTVGGSVSHAAIGALMTMTPGVAFTMGIRDFVHGDYLSGTIRMIDAVLVAVCLACGTGAVLAGYTALTGRVAV